MDRRFAARLTEPAPPGGFEAAELSHLDEPVGRYFQAAIAPGTTLARTARFRMRGRIKVGNRWLPFQATQIESPHRGFLWVARVGGAIVGSDRYLEGAGGMDWRLLGVFGVAHAAGPDVSRSAAGRGGAEAIWVPTALLPRSGVRWEATSETAITASYQLDETAIDLRLTIDSDGRPLTVVFDRWGDPDNSGTWGYHPFGFEVTRHAAFDGVTIPASGRAGWHFGTDRWAEGEFFRSEITQYELVRQCANP